MKVTARVAARLDGAAANASFRGLKIGSKPYWDLERARLGDTREVPVEVVVNGQPAARRTIVADGTIRDVTFDVPIDRSSWVALRILPSSHTNPVFVLVGGKPIRASRASVEWCLAGVDRCWESEGAEDFGEGASGGGARLRTRASGLSPAAGGERARSR